MVCKNVKKKKKIQHRIPQKRNPCNLDNLHILSDPDHQLSSLGHFHLLSFVFVSPLASFAMQCVAPSGGSIAFYTALVSHPHPLSFDLRTFLVSSLSQPHLATEKGCFQDNLMHRNFQTARKNPQKILPSKDGVHQNKNLLPS